MGSKAVFLLLVGTRLAAGVAVAPAHNGASTHSHVRGSRALEVGPYVFTKGQLRPLSSDKDLYACMEGLQEADTIASGGPELMASWGVLPPKPEFQWPNISHGGAFDGKSNIAVDLPKDIFIGQNDSFAHDPEFRDPADPCQCKGAITGGVCYPTLALAVAHAVEGAAVRIGNTLSVPHPVGFNTATLSFEGQYCNETKATLVADFDEPTGAILMPNADLHNITIKNLVFTRGNMSAFASGLRGTRYGQVFSLYTYNSNFRKLRTKASGGAAIYISRAHEVIIDNLTTFTDNVVDTLCDSTNFDQYCVYGGGGALYVNAVREGRLLRIDGTWSRNHHYFQHGLGGAVCVEDNEGLVEIVGQFFNNTASDGAAVHIGNVRLHATLNVTGYFRGNHAVDFTWGTRGGAIRPWFVDGTVNMDGTYVDNLSDGRGAVFASNRIRNTSNFNVKGTYIDNISYGWGTVVSVTNEVTGNLTLDGSCTFSGNLAYNPNHNIVSIVYKQSSLGESEWKNRTVVFHFTDALKWTPDMG